MALRRMADFDLDMVVELEKRLFDDPWSLKSFEYEVRHNPYSLPLILEENETNKGYAIIWKIYEEFHIANFAIHPDFQGNGLGTYFLQEIFKFKDDSQYAILEVRENNKRAVHLYEKFGFKIIMKRPRYYPNGETALVMQKIFKKTDPSSAKM